MVKSFFISPMVSLIVLLNNKGYPLKILLKWTRGLLNKEEFLRNFCIWSVPIDSV